MTMCEAVSDRMPAVAAGRSEWAAEERAHLVSCSGCEAEWTLVRMATVLGRDVTVEAATLTPLSTPPRGSRRDSDRSERPREA